jgi:hypothetical protein
LSRSWRVASHSPRDRCCRQSAPQFLVRQEATKFPRLTLCTLYRVISGHAFIGSYTQRLFPQHTPEQVACPCDEPVKTVERVLFDCLVHTAVQRKRLTACGRPRKLSQLFNHPKRVVTLIRSMEETGACEKPRSLKEVLRRGRGGKKDAR